jgi:hypothetical protein
LAGRFGGRILPDFGQKWQKRGRRKFKFAEFGHLLDAALCFKLKQPAPPPQPARGRERRYDMNGRFQMQGGKNWILPK